MLNFIESLLTVLLIVFILGWIWYFQFSPPGYDNIALDTIKFKTGDLILFKALDNWHAPKIGCYFSHVGLVVVNNNTPYIFEAAATSNISLNDNENRRGIFITPLATRVCQYRGYTFYKRLCSDVHLNDVQLYKFIDYALQHMQYNYDILWTSIKKGLGLEECNDKTNCGELVFRSLCCLGIIDEQELKRARPHYLNDVCYIQDCGTGFAYDAPLQITYSPFQLTIP